MNFDICREHCFEGKKHCRIFCVFPFFYNNKIERKININVQFYSNEENINNVNEIKMSFLVNFNQYIKIKKIYKTVCKDFGMIYDSDDSNEFINYLKQFLPCSCCKNGCYYDDEGVKCPYYVEHQMSDWNNEK